MVLFASIKTMAVLQSDVNVGNITEVNGIGRVVRDQEYQAQLDFDINSYDNVQTANGRMGITFIDDTTIKITEHSQVIIDEFVFDPNPDKSKMALTFAKGTARFITGSLGKVKKENIVLRTNSATIGIRGTDFTVTVDELGRSLIILLPLADGTSSGEIVVSTAAGQVVLNQPYQATTASVFEAMPTKPVILDITLDLIDNMLIVNPPQEERLETAESSSTSNSNLLDVDFLEFEELDKDYLDENFYFNELDVNYLDVNFLEDLLEVIEELDQLAIREQKTVGEQLFTELDIKGTNYGTDSSTQITTFGDADKITLIRSVTHSVQLDLNGQTQYNIIIEQDGKAYNVIINSGSSSTITIKQSSG